MRLRVQNERSRAFAPLEVLVVLVLIAILFLLIFLLTVVPKPHAQAINCAGNLKQVNLAFRIWEGDNNDQYPMTVSVTNGGGRELIASGNVAGFLQVMSNEVGIAKIFLCPADPDHKPTPHWGEDMSELGSSNISYFFSTEASNGSPDMILDGDDNFEMNGLSLKSGLFDLSSNTLVAWAPGRHREFVRPRFWSFPERICLGNIGFVDGHVDQFVTSQLQNRLRNMARETNRIAIP